jgi:hypothetical protein
MSESSEADQVRQNEMSSEFLSFSGLRRKLEIMTSKALSSRAQQLGMELIDLDQHTIDCEKKNRALARINRLVSSINFSLNGAQIVVISIDSQDEKRFGIGIKLEGAPVTSENQVALETAKQDLKSELMSFVEVIVPRSQTEDPTPQLYSRASVNPRRDEVSKLLGS